METFHIGITNCQLWAQHPKHKPHINKKSCNNAPLNSLNIHTTATKREEKRSKKSRQKRKALQISFPSVWINCEQQMSVSKALHPLRQSPMFSSRERWKTRPGTFTTVFSLAWNNLCLQRDPRTRSYVDACVSGDAISVEPPISDLSPRGEAPIFFHFDVLCAGFECCHDVCLGFMVFRLCWKIFEALQCGA